jgi:aspartyl-tRNA(Asn)/glutamyl-tRNA(Gln) amidotransferase subunit A
MADPALARLSLAEAGDLLRRRALSPVELAEAVLARIETLNPVLNAFITLVPRDEVLAAARQAERDLGTGMHRGPLHGIPVGVKDLIDTAGLRTTYGSGAFSNHVPAVDGAVPERLRAAGAIITGKTATHELGKGITTNNYFYGPTRNPWNLEHVPGGSSGGAAAAAAACMGPLQIGTDGGGSIRFPALFCGVTGLKPTLGLISNRGQFGGLGGSFSVPGPLTRGVRDAAIAAQALAGFDPAYPYSRPSPVPDLLRDLESGVRGLRVGASPDLLVPPPEPAMRAAYEATLARLEQLGAQLVELAMPNHERVLRGLMGLFGTEAAVAQDVLFQGRPPLFSPRVERINQLMPAPTVAACLRLFEDRQLIGRDYLAAFCEVDVMIAPVAPFAAPRIDADEMRFVTLCCPYTGAANLVGFPSVPLPAGTSDGLPLGIQVMAPIGGDAVALRVARALEQAAPEHRVQLPPLDATPRAA